MTKKGLVISGGGAWGAWGAGVAKGLCEFQNRDYDVYVGTSTGAYIAPLAAVNEFDKLEQAYTSINNNSVWRISPFSDSGRIKYITILSRLLRGKTSLGDSSNLKKLIDSFIIESDYIKIKELNKKVACSVTNLSKMEVEYYNTDDCHFEDYKKWMEISGSFPILMNLNKKNNSQYADGGLIDSVPIEYAIEQGCTEIDVIIHRTKNNGKRLPIISNIINLLKRVIMLIVQNISKDDLHIANTIKDIKEDITINYYYMPKKYIDNPLDFNTNIMKRIFQIGYLSMNRKDVTEKMRTQVTVKSNQSERSPKKTYYNDKKLQK